MNEGEYIKYLLESETKRTGIKYGRSLSREQINIFFKNALEGRGIPQEWLDSEQKEQNIDLMREQELWDELQLYLENPDCFEYYLVENESEKEDK